MKLLTKLISAVCAFTMIANPMNVSAANSDLPKKSYYVLNGYSQEKLKEYCDERDILFMSLDEIDDYINEKKAEMYICFYPETYCSTCIEDGEVKPIEEAVFCAEKKSDLTMYYARTCDVYEMLEDVGIPTEYLKVSAVNTKYDDPKYGKKPFARTRMVGDKLEYYWVVPVRILPTADFSEKTRLEIYQLSMITALQCDTVEGVIMDMTNAQLAEKRSFEEILNMTEKQLETYCSARKMPFMSYEDMRRRLSGGGRMRVLVTPDSYYGGDGGVFSSKDEAELTRGFAAECDIDRAVADIGLPVKYFGEIAVSDMVNTIDDRGDTTYYSNISLELVPPPELPEALRVKFCQAAWICAKQSENVFNTFVKKNVDIRKTFDEIAEMPEDEIKSYCAEVGCDYASLEETMKRLRQIDTLDIYCCPAVCCDIAESVFCAEDHKKLTSDFPQKCDMDKLLSVLGLPEKYFDYSLSNYDFASSVDVADETWWYSRLCLNVALSGEYKDKRAELYRAAWICAMQSAAADEVIVQRGAAPNSASGDLDGDGETTVADMVLLQYAILGKDTETDMAAADLYPDGMLNAYDMCLLRKKLIQK